MTAADDRRPEWPYKLTEAQVLLLAGHITQINHRWEMTGVDTSRNWIEFKSDKGKAFSAPDGWAELFEFAPNHHASLIRPNYRGEQAIKRLDEIKKFEAKHATERAEFERLKRKFDAV
ncbi:hypothetical protein IED13_00870 [Bosea sp. SSUT16]|uniref:Uncharacterized protein n=1 Tax=Bosea spartocytisi TaxID=2773451 RepID=A0A927E5Y2_9HYPH|nr:hypothetical protein [Bosea spartocytisi]MBD3844230.1 hypothetical protein [Bosea spartocytisi]MCT4470661.1 hypothetical protein [Bosea spartocytisi]